MKHITVKKARRLCVVSACKNTDTYRVSGSPNILGGFYICPECAAEIARLTKEKKRAEK